MNETKFAEFTVTNHNALAHLEQYHKQTEYAEHTMNNAIRIVIAHHNWHALIANALIHVPLLSLVEVSFLLILEIILISIVSNFIFIGNFSFANSQCRMQSARHVTSKNNGLCLYRRLSRKCCRSMR